ncbi:lamin tail domain-containing protein [Candidatus Saccharibacteria bacterium]|nr:lamin tail domain-containing protein [Candidatus Saccharibacteria bacterium]
MDWQGVQRHHLTSTIYRTSFVMTLLMLPYFAQAAIVINEVAWMGDSDSPNNEWIELHNTGDSAVSVDGWRLADDATLEIVLFGTISAGSYAVLERTDDDSAPGSAFLIYTGALSNSGATLTLYRADNGIEDRVVGGDNWENIGGDNTEKYTAQYTAAGWVTAEATPGSTNSTESEPVETSGDKNKTTSSPSGFSRGRVVEPIRLVLPDNELVVFISGPTVGYVNQPITFSVSGEGIGETLIDSLQYQWNYGDLSVDTGSSVTHTYQYPGEYVVYVSGSYARHEASTRHEITILPVAFSLTRAPDGAVQIHNNAKYEIDLSGFTLRGARTVTFPDHTVLLPNKTLTIPEQKIGTATEVLLRDQTGQIVATTQTTTAESTGSQTEMRQTIAVAPAAAPAVSVVNQVDELPTTPTGFGFASDQVPTSSDVSEEFHQTESSQQVASVATATSSDRLPYLGLIGVMGLALFSLFYTRQS